MTQTETRPREAAAQRLGGKVALVVGGGWSGPEDFPLSVGCAICQTFARGGARVAVFDIEDANAERTLAEMREDGHDALKIVGDTAVRDDCRRAVQEVLDEYGQLDILINNVGLGLPPGMDPRSEEAFDRVMDVNFDGLIYMVREAVGHMPRGGAIVNIGSVFGAVDPIPGAYAMSKRAMSLVMTPTFAKEYAPLGIRVNCISIGYIWNAVTKNTKGSQGDPSQSMEDYRYERSQTLNPLKLEGDGWDVAYAAAFLASDDARWITAQDLTVDGGYSVMSYWEKTPYAQRAFRGLLLPEE